MSHGPMPAAIYWRRRLVLVALLLAGVWLVLRFTGGDGQSTPRAEASAAPKPAPVVVPTNGALEVALAADERACDPEQVRITPSIPSDQLSGRAITIDLVVSTAEKGPCTLKPADAELIAVISANDTPVFDSTVCTSSLLKDPVSLAGGGWATVAPITWSGRGSGRSCGGSERLAGAGRYTVQVGTLGGEPGKATFALKSPPKPKSPKPKPTKPKPSPTPTKKKTE